MGDTTIVSATYVVGTQSIDVADIIEEIRSKNYGEINLPITKLDADLRKDNRIALAANDPTLALTPPRITVEYTDERGAWHTISSTLTETLKIGQRSTFGTLIQKPFDALWQVAMTVGKGQMIFVIAMGYALVVLWTYKQWEYMQEPFKPMVGSVGNPGMMGENYAEKFGPLGKWIALAIFTIFVGGEFLSEKIAKFFKPTQPWGYSWVTKLFPTIISAFAPIYGFVTQFILWVMIVKNIPK